MITIGESGNREKTRCIGVATRVVIEKVGDAVYTKSRQGSTRLLFYSDDRFDRRRERYHKGQCITTKTTTSEVVVFVV